LKQLLDTCPRLKVLVTSEQKLMKSYICIKGVVEYPITIPSLSPHSAVELFAKIAPALRSNSMRKSFIEAFQPAAETDGRFHSEALLMGGNPSSIVQMAVESTSKEIEALKKWAENYPTDGFYHSDSQYQ